VSKIKAENFNTKAEIVPENANGLTESQDENANFSASNKIIELRQGTSFS